jgi:parvulin-like peptidyl-prolyl isomerase
MSASSEKKARQAAREAGTDKKTLALEKEAKEKAKSKRRWTLGTIVIVLLVAAILLLNTSLPYKTTAVTIGDESYSASQMNYYYANQYYYFVQQYGSYASIFGLDTSSGYKGLASQSCAMYGDGSTWKDYFLQLTESELLQEKALRDYAAENGLVLDEEEIAAVDANFDGMDEYATSLGYASADKLFAANYGTGVTAAMVMQAYYDSALAVKATTSYSSSLEYTQEEIKAQYASYEGEQDYFNYVYYYLAADTEDVAGEDGETTSEVTDTTLAAAEETANAVLAAYKEQEGDEYTDKLDAALAEAGVDGTSYNATNTQGSSLNSAFKEWLMDSSRKAGDVEVTVDSSSNGYYVVIFVAREDNDYNMAQFRHILIKAEADEDGNYTDEALAEAKAKAEEILAEFNAGDKTEESFAALAEEYSEDSGSNTNGGLYDSVTKGQMVTNVNDFAFADHQPGDTDIVYGESSSYAGYHIMYYVGQGDNYADYLAESDLAETDLQNWLSDLVANYTVTEKFGMRLVG